MSRPVPECPHGRSDCLFTVGPTTVTAAYYPPRYDASGRNINPDRNNHVTSFRCEACGERWYRSQVGEDEPVFVAAENKVELADD